MYAPRPVSTEPYHQFQQGYLDAIDSILLQHSPLKSHLAWTELETEVRAAVVKFFKKFEEVTEEKVRVAERIKNRGRIKLSELG